MGNSWFLEPMTVLDLETTGVSVHHDRAVTGFVATLWPAHRGARVQVDARVLINPGVPIPWEATKIHGITDEIARTKGAPPDEGVHALVTATRRAMQAGFPVIAFNAAYDLSMLYWECLRHGVETIHSQLGCQPDSIAPVVDPHVLDKHAEPYRPGSRKLGATCARWGVELKDAHNAEADAMAAGRLAFLLAQQFRQFGHVALGRLHEFQREWKAEQAAGYQTYLRSKKGKPDAVIDRCWPVCTDMEHAEVRELSE